jgi:hypothetical protein
MEFSMFSKGIIGSEDIGIALRAGIGDQVLFGFRISLRKNKYIYQL